MATYGQVAEWIGAYGCARQVGWALRRLRLPSSVPWHRVVNARGEVSMSLSREGSDWMQRELLIAEGIPVSATGQLPLARFLWRLATLPEAPLAVLPEATDWGDAARGEALQPDDHTSHPRTPSQR